MPIPMKKGYNFLVQHKKYTSILCLHLIFMRNTTELASLSAATDRFQRRGAPFLFTKVLSLQWTFIPITGLPRFPTSFMKNIMSALRRLWQNV